jgi:hypothetical protein
VKLSKFDLISPSSYFLAGVGHIKAVKLSDIDALPQKNDTYQMYTSLMLCDAEKLYKVLGVDGDYTASTFDVFTSDSRLTGELLLLLDFFLEESIAYVNTEKKYVTFVGEEAVGVIDGSNFDEVVSVILQRCGIGDDKKKEKPTFKNKRAKEIWEKTHATETPKDFADRENYDLGNVVAHLASRGSGLNILNIWDMTVYNVYDQFMILRKGIAHEVGSTNAAVWGDKDNKFDLDSWFKVH